MFEKLLAYLEEHGVRFVVVEHLEAIARKRHA
jgi:hypothetical protein